MAGTGPAGRVCRGTGAGAAGGGAAEPSGRAFRAGAPRARPRGGARGRQDTAVARDHTAADAARRGGTVAARLAATVRLRHPGRDAHRRPDQGLAEGRQGLARAGARGFRQALHPVAEDQHRHRRGGGARRLDGLPGQRCRRTAGGGIRARAQADPAARAQPGSHRQGRHARRAGHGGVVFAQPAWQWADRQPAAAAERVSAGRSQRPVPDRHAGCRAASAAQLPPGLHPRPAQQRHHVGARLGGVAGDRDAKPLLCRQSERTAAWRAAGCAGAVAAEVPAGHTQHVRRPAFLAGAAARVADARAPRRCAHRADDAEHARLQRRPGALAATCASSSAGGWRRRIRPRRCPSR